MNNKTIIYSVIVIVALAVLAFLSFNYMKAKNISSDNTNNNANATDGFSSLNHSGDPGSLPDGIKASILKEGTGQTAKAGDTVFVNYTGKLSDGTVFDSNTDPKFSHVKPFKFVLGSGQVIQGWDEGVVGMRVGEERKLVISPAYAYGASGIKDIIPPNATLTFDVTLLSIGGGK